MVYDGPASGWYRSSRCTSESGCVEVAILDEGRVGVRDAKLPASSPYLVFGRDVWNGFVADLKAGRHHRP